MNRAAIFFTTLVVAGCGGAEIPGAFPPPPTPVEVLLDRRDAILRHHLGPFPKLLALLDHGTPLCSSKFDSCGCISRYVRATVPAPDLGRFTRLPFGRRPTRGRVSTKALSQGNSVDCTQSYLGLHRVDDALWKRADGSGVTVVDLDAGFVRHNELAGFPAVGSANLVSPNASVLGPPGDVGHGLGVTCQIGASHDQSKMTGIAPAATLVALKVQDSDNGDLCTWAAGLDYAIATRADRPILLLEGQLNQDGATYSIESDPQIRCLESCALRQGDVVVVPAGNGMTTARAPGDTSITGAIIVGAAAPNGDASWGTGYSNGDVNVVSYAYASDTNNLTCDPGGSYTCSFGGTSSAAAKMAGIAALVADAANRRKAALTPGDVCRIIGIASNPDCHATVPVIDATRAVDLVSAWVPGSLSGCASVELACTPVDQ